MQPARSLLTGTAFALAAGLMWGLVFVAPLILPDYPPALLAFGRYLAFGLIALPLAWLDRDRIARLSTADWRAALMLGLVGNIVYYLLLSAAIQRAGGPLPTMIIGTLPVVIAIAVKLRRPRAGAAIEARWSWRRMSPSLLLIGVGIGCVNQAELQQLGGVDSGADPELMARYVAGAWMAVGALACWTWYPIRNADWLRAHPDRSPGTWATAQGLATLPMAAAGLLAFWLWSAATGAVAAVGIAEPFAMPLGPRPGVYLGLMVTMGLFASWLGTLCWNEASQRLPPALSGQLIVFETLAALVYAFLWRGAWPTSVTLLGIGLLLAGVTAALWPRRD